MLYVPQAHAQSQYTLSLKSVTAGMSWDTLLSVTALIVVLELACTRVPLVYLNELTCACGRDN